MNRATSPMRNFARRLMACESLGKKSSGIRAPADFPECERLRPQLATLMGNAGYRALLARAIALAGTEVPSLRSLHVRSDGSLEGLEDLHARLAPAEFVECRGLLLAHLLGLLVTFIGEDLTLRLVRELWPKLRLDDLDFEKGKS